MINGVKDMNGFRSRMNLSLTSNASCNGGDEEENAILVRICIILCVVIILFSHSQRVLSCQYSHWGVLWVLCVLEVNTLRVYVNNPSSNTLYSTV